jgi:hypothetical protein
MARVPRRNTLVEPVAALSISVARFERRVADLERRVAALERERRRRPPIIRVGR